MSVVFTISVEGDTAALVRLADFPVRMRAEVRPRLVQVGDRVANDMRGRASKSKRIPGAIKVKPSFAAGPRQGVTISVDHNAAPHAFVHAKTKLFRHPVRGTDTWVSQIPINYWVPAIKAGRLPGEALMRDVIRAMANR